MGRPMGLNLLGAGFSLGVWARNAEACVPLQAAGATVYSSPYALAQAVDVLISIVTSSEDVCGLAYGEHGVLAGLAAGAIHVDMSTISIAVARELAAAYQAQGRAFLDAPVSGGALGAQNASLAIMVGGEAAHLNTVRPVFEALGKKIVHVGPAGAGQVAKACNQMVMVNTIQACAEAMLLAGAHQVSLAAVRTALSAGSAGSRVLEVMGERMVARDFAAGIEARLHHKDFGLIMQEGFKLGAHLPITAQVWQQLNALMGQGWGQHDTSSLLKVLQTASQPNE
jgi:2-hydroxy-3-oxopropionate reductase